MKRNNKLLCLLISLVVLVLVIACIVITDNEVIAKANEDTISIDIVLQTEKMLGKRVDKYEYLYNIDDVEDYIYVKLQGEGYAIFTKNSFELLEYSLDGTLPYESNNNIKYYAGPMQYFEKRNGALENLITNEIYEYSESILNSFAKQQRNRFKQQDTSYSYIENVSEDKSPSYIDPPETATLQGELIENAQFFLNDPIHGMNTTGTCKSVAVQLLLNYHNFYSDRRIIDNQYLFSENNPNTTIDPMDMTSKTLGSTDQYYNYLQGIVQPSNIVKNAIDTILNARGIAFSTEYIYNALGGAVSSSGVVAELNKNRPVYVSMGSNLGGRDHAVVVYGYEDYTYPGTQESYSGYVAHMGWSRNNATDYTMDQYAIKAWINASWCDGYTKLYINHNHIYDTYVGGNYHEEKCSTCGHRKYAYTTEIQSLDEVSLTGLTQDITGEYLIIPNRINGRYVKNIGYGVFDGQSTLKIVALPANLKSIDENAFSNCTQLSTITIPSNVDTIGSSAFAWCTALETIAIPSGVQRIEDSTFGASGLVSVDFASSETVTYIGVSAFGYCGNLTDLILPHSVTEIGISAFAFTSLSYIVVPYDCVTIGNNAFNSCSNLTIYTGRSSSAANWGSNWNNSSRPVVWGCSLIDDVVMSFEKSENNPTSTTNINNPERKGYTFDGWYTTSDFSGTSYSDITQAPNGTLYAKWSEIESSCVAEGTLITLADGSQVAVENLTGNEELLVWNMLTGSYDTAPILFIDSDPLASYQVIELTFSDGTEVKVIDEHAFWCFELNEYVYLDENASSYVGYHFNKNSGNGYVSVELIGVEIYEEVTRAYSPVTYGHLCYYVNGMLSMPGGITGFINIFDVVATELKYYEDAMEEDIATYGLYTYEEFTQEVAEIPEEIFLAFNGQYLKVAMGKGLITEEEILSLIARYAEFF